MELQSDQPDGLIFLSYSTDDKHLVGEIKSGLDAFGFDAFLAHEDLVPSEEWLERINRELAKCDVFMPILTENFRRSLWTDQEAGHALARQPKCLILSLLVPPTISPHGFLKQYQALVYDINDSERMCARIVKIVEDKLGISEVRKERAIQPFRESGSYATKRNMKVLRTFDRFSEAQMDAILTAAFTNSQIGEAFRIR